MKNKNKIAIYPGTFDPITLGHIDIIKRSTKIFDKIIVVIGNNSIKQCLFNEKERLNMTIYSLKDLDNIEIVINDKLTIDIAKKYGASVIIRGLRAVSDFDYEFQIALMNRKLCLNIDTIFMLPDEKYTYLSSTIVKELAMYNEDLHPFVTDYVANKLKEKIAINKTKI